MKILRIVLAVLAGRYIELPTWQVILFVPAAVWSLHQINRDWKEEKGEDSCCKYVKPKK